MKKTMEAVQSENTKLKLEIDHLKEARKSEPQLRESVSSDITTNERTHSAASLLIGDFYVERF